MNSKNILYDISMCSIKHMRVRIDGKYKKMYYPQFISNDVMCTVYQSEIAKTNGALNVYTKCVEFIEVSDLCETETEAIRVLGLYINQVYNSRTRYKNYQNERNK